MLLAVDVSGQIGISPARTEFYMDGPTKTHTIRVFNLGQEPVDVAVKVNHWELDENNEVVTIPPTEQSLDQWLIINPLQFTLEPGGSQAVRFAARPRVQPDPGEHRAMIYFEELPRRSDPTSEPAPQVLFRFGTSVIGLVEPVVREAVVHSIAADLNQITIDVESVGNTHVRLDGQWALWPADAFPGREETGLIEGLGKEEDVALPEGVIAAWVLNSLPVLPGTRREIVTVLGSTPEPGRYVVDINGSVAGQDLDRTIELEVTLPPEENAFEQSNGEQPAVVEEPAPEATPTVQR